MSERTLIVIELHTFPAEFLEQGFDLGVLEFTDLLLALIDETTEYCKQNVPWLEQK
jgi:hypothetical protein